MRYTLPLSSDKGILVCGLIDLPRPMTQAQWDRMMAILDVMKPALVEPHLPEPSDPEVRR